MFAQSEVLFGFLSQCFVDNLFWTNWKPWKVSRASLQATERNKATSWLSSIFCWRPWDAGAGKVLLKISLSPSLPYIFLKFWFCWVSQMSHSSSTECLFLLLCSKYHGLLRNLSEVNSLTGLWLLPQCSNSQCWKAEGTTGFSKPIPYLCEGTTPLMGKHRESKAWLRRQKNLSGEAGLCFGRNRKADSPAHFV